MKRIKVGLADDHAVLRAGLKMLLSAQADIEVVGEAATGEEAIELALRMRPDILLLDIAMPGMGGLEAIRLLREKAPDTRVLILTMHDDEDYLLKALKSGAAGYVLKEAADTELILAVRAVCRGELYVHPRLTRVLVEGLLDERQDESGMGRRGPLTDREKEVLRLIALGHTNQQIAELLFLSVKTVESHKARIMDKLGLRKRSELVRYAISEGFVSLD